MRPSTILLQCCALLQCAAAKDAYLYTFDDELRSPSSNPTIISTDIAFAIASRRQGCTDELSLEGVDKEAVWQISKHGGYQQMLFSEATTSEPPRVLVRIHADTPEPGQILQKKPTFKIHDPTTDLLKLEAQSPDRQIHMFSFTSEEGVRLVCRFHVETSIVNQKGDLLSIKNGKPITEILESTRSFLDEAIDLMSASIDMDFTFSKVSESVIASHIDAFIAYLYSSISTSNYQPTLFLIPPTSQLASSSIPMNKRRDLEEELLDLTIPAISDFSLDNPSTYKKNTTLPRRFPSCFSSKESCRNATNDCSGHGSCKASGSSKNCFQCKCGRTTIRTNNDGSKKTNLWAGAACQKKDISFEFTLFAVLGVTMAMLITGVIGMMVSMGGQELPSVIGAGVAGPAARKG